MSVDQTSFAGAVLDPDRQMPAGLTDPDGKPDQKRFAVYRNNVTISLQKAMQSAFPIIEKLVGSEFFEGMALTYVRAHPPTSPLMMFYGEELPEFLQRFEPAKSLQYLPDIARLELAIRKSYHAADAKPVEPPALQDLTTDLLMAAQFEFAPAMRLVNSAWPIHAIYVLNTQENAPKPVMQSEGILISRPEYDPVINLLPMGGIEFISALQGGKPFAEALHAAGENFDLTTTLGILLGGGCIIKINLPGTKP